MNVYFAEFAAFAVANTLCLISPGPDFAMIVRSSLRNGRRTAIFVGFGIALGEMMHMTYTILGLGVVLNESETLMSTIKYIGAAYLLYLGIQSLRAKKAPAQAGEASAILPTITPLKAIRAGFLTNALNAKAAFLTMSIFTVLVSSATPFWVKTIYGVFNVTTTFAWFALVATFLTSELLQARFFAIKHWIERVTGAILIALALQLAFGEMAML